jgi:2-amino-4-hydroxy-6-hydroxymethyldihydropteridine diphosphokinase
VTIAAIALGSNLGDRASHIGFAAERLRSLLDNCRISRTIETSPEDVREPQPPFLNAAAVGETSLDARALLDALLAIERERGRQRPYAGAARTLDLDLILFGADVIDSADLTVPHPRFRTRRFVLAPLAEIAPDLVDPMTAKTVSELLRDL